MKTWSCPDEHVHTQLHVSKRLSLLRTTDYMLNKRAIVSCDKVEPGHAGMYVPCMVELKNPNQARGVGGY